jgi:hypothetical protein
LFHLDFINTYSLSFFTFRALQEEEERKRSEEAAKASAAAAEDEATRDEPNNKETDETEEKKTKKPTKRRRLNELSQLESWAFVKRRAGRSNTAASAKSSFAAMALLNRTKSSTAATNVNFDEMLSEYLPASLVAVAQPQREAGGDQRDADKTPEFGSNDVSQGELQGDES